MSDMLQELRDLLQEKSIQTKDRPYTLVSGAKSDYYCDTKASVLSPRGAKLIGEVVYSRIVGAGVEAVGGLAMGSLFISTAVSVVSEQHGRPIYGFFVRPQAKDHGLKLSVEQSHHPDGRPLLCKGRPVAVVEDVVTAGGSISKAIREIEALGCEIKAVVALVDRGAGGGAMLRDQGYPYQALFLAEANGTLRINDGGPGTGRLASGEAQA